MADKIAIVLSLDQAQEFVRRARSAERSVHELGTASDRTGRQMERAGRRSRMFQRGITGVVAGIKYGALIGIAALTVAVGGSVTAFGEADDIMRQQVNTIKATGGVAKVTQKDLASMAKTMSLRTGIDDEAIASAQSMLLTFKGVRNEVGKHGNIYDRTITAIADLAAFKGTDLVSTAQMVGKALNDPAKGAVALSKGGSLAKSELKKLQDMAKAGVPVWRQQEYILRALEGQYKGAAVASGQGMGGSLRRLRVIVGNLAEWLGEKLAPTVEKVADFLSGFGMHFERMTSKGVVGVVAFRVALIRMTGANSTAVKVFDTLRVALPKIWQGMKTAGKWIAYAGGELHRLAVKYWPTLQREGAKAIAWLGKGSKDGKGFIVDLVATIRVWLGIAGKFWNRWGAGIFKDWKDHIGNVLRVAANVLGLLVNTVRFWLAVFRGDWKGAWKALKKQPLLILKAVASIFELFARAVLISAKNFWRIMLSVFGGLWHGIEIGCSKMTGWVIRKLGELETWVTTLPGKLASAGSGMWSWIKEGFSTAFNWVLDKLRTFDISIAPIPKLHFEGITIQPFKDLPGLAKGGTSTRSGWAMVGEQGPEMRFMPRGASVVPLPRVPEFAGARASSRAGLDPTAGFAAAVARAVADALADMPILVELDGERVYQNTMRRIKHEGARR